jgi:heme o synthase
MVVASRSLVPSRLLPGRRGHAGSRTPKSKIQGYIALTKPQIIELLLVTTIPTMVVAQRGWPSWKLVIATFLGGTLSAGGANAVNMYVDRDIDKIMPRTQQRPLVTGVVTPRSALIFAISLQILAFVVLSVWVNILSALLALSAACFYIFIYTLWLKRTSKQNIVIGGAAGAVPVLIGWSSVTNSLSWAPIVLFVVMFLWTPPHFWALAIKYADDYRAADVPMLPAIESLAVTSKKIVTYTVALVVSSFVFLPVAHLSWLYGVSAVVLGGMFLWGGIDLLRGPTPSKAMRLFGFSITYVTLLFVAMAVDAVFLGVRA